ncbi:replication initiation protein [Pseudomonas sp. Pseusp122]|uniref:replication initiation protein n=1 Tax=unclassified Pseudomonas TaxID=196821 RepID=UPI0039A608C6
MQATIKAYADNVSNEGARRRLFTRNTYTPSPRFFKTGTALNRILFEAPYLSRCSDDKTAARIRPREYALRYPYMQINRPGMVSWLIFDLDHPNSLIWNDAGLPAPNLTVRNGANGHSHLYYAIEPVCTTENARSRPIQYMKAVYAAFAARLNADTEYNSGPVAKTPDHPWWRTTEFHGLVYQLGELADYVELGGQPWRTGPNLDQVSHSRHCMLFERLRYFAYSIVNREREQGSFSGFVQSLEAYAHKSNTFHELGFSENLPWSSLRATVKSVARWTWDRYTGDGRCNRGVMQLDKALPLAERQRLAAKRTHEERHKATESKIRLACQGLKRRGEALVQTAIAGLTRLTRQTVAAYAYVIEEFRRPPVETSTPIACEPPQNPTPRAESGATTDVKHAANQVTQPPAACFGSAMSSSPEIRTVHSDGEWCKEMSCRAQVFGSPAAFYNGGSTCNVNRLNVITAAHNIDDGVKMEIPEGLNIT